MRNARTHREKEEIALVAMLDLNDKTVTDLNLDCKHAGTCKVTKCRNLLKKMIKEGLVQKKNSRIEKLPDISGLGVDYGSIPEVPGLNMKVGFPLSRHSSYYRELVLSSARGRQFQPPLYLPKVIPSLR